MMLPEGSNGKYLKLIIITGLIAIVAINPITIMRLSSPDSAVGSSAWALLSAIFDAFWLYLMGFSFIFNRRLQLKGFLTNNLILVLSLVLVVGAVKIVDFVFGKVQSRNYSPGLLFARNAAVTYQTPEYQYTAHVNNLGFRGPDPEPNLPDSVYKIVVFGDSFTYGWGLSDEQTWPVLVERELHERGVNARIYNLGKPGSEPAEFARLTPKVISLLHPDLIILNVLQGDDLFQIAYEKRKRSTPQKAHQLISRSLSGFVVLLTGAYPNLTSLFAGIAERKDQRPTLNVAATWKQQSEEIYRAFTPAEKVIYQRISQNLRTMFENGELNPLIIYLAVKVPADERFARYENLQDPETKKAINLLADCFRTIQQAALRANCEVVVSVVPHQVYVSPVGAEVMRQLCFVFADSLLSTTNSESAVRIAAEDVGLEFYSPLQRFRAACDQMLYFKYDGHFNPEGAREYADYLAEIIIQKQAAWKRHRNSPNE